MRAVLLRTASPPVHDRFVPGSPISLSRRDSNGDRSSIGLFRFSLNVKTSDRSQSRGIRRVSSDSDVVRSERDVFSKLSGIGSKSPQARMPEEEVDGWGSLIWNESGVPAEELGFSGDGFGEGFSDSGRNGDTNRGGDYGDKSEIGGYYREMLKSNPDDSLLLMNYGKFLYDVEKDVERAGEYYGRAILASPGGDGEALSMYGKLIWETQRDESRAKSYFDQAVYASPNDCMVLGSYAHFMWEADEEDEETKEEEVAGASPAMVAAF